MEESIKEETPLASVNSSKSKLRYPLRSATKAKEAKPLAVESTSSSAPRRGRSASTVSRSVGVLNLSAKEKSAKPPRRLSIPANSSSGSGQKSVGNITPISEARTKRSGNTQGRSDTPISDVRASSRKKFNILASSSYWLSQIKLSESAAKHSISLGFFKLAVDAGCEPLQRMRDELKSYARRHDLSELGEAVKDLFDRYNISETLEQVQVSETCSQVPEEGTRSSDDEVHSSSSTIRPRKLKPKSLNTDAPQVSSAAESVKKETTPKNNHASRIRASLNKNSTNAKTVSDTGSRMMQKKPQKPVKQEINKKEKIIKKQEKKSACEEGPNSCSSPPAEDKVEENKENMDASMEITVD